MPEELRPAAALVDQARRAQTRGEYELARDLLERALREAPRDTSSDIVFSRTDSSSSTSSAGIVPESACQKSRK